MVVAAVIEAGCSGDGGGCTAVIEAGFSCDGSAWKLGTAGMMVAAQS